MSRILILEDNLPLALEWKHALEEVEHEVYHEDDVDAAISILEEQEIDVLLCDILIQVQAKIAAKGGLSLLYYINKQLPQDKRPKVIGVSGLTDHIPQERGLLATDLFLWKPVKLDELLTHIDQLTNSESGESTS